MDEPIRIFIADDHPVVRRGIKGLLETEPDMVVVGEAANGREAVSGIMEVAPDIALMDLVMPVMDGIEAIRQIKAGASGYLIKDTAPADLLQAIRQVQRGEPTLHPAIAQKLLQEVSGPPEQPPEVDPLTEREVEVLQLVAKGLSNQEIADQLVIGLTTVYSHVSNILAKLHLASRTQAALYALREGYASLYDEPGKETLN